MPRPDPIDIHVGGRIRLRRTILRMSQEKLADQLDITFQQVQKYENGSNRVGASRLYNISQILGVEVGYFYEGYESDITYDTIEDAVHAKTEALIKDRKNIEFMRLLANRTAKQQNALIGILRSMEVA